MMPTELFCAALASCFCLAVGLRRRQARPGGARPQGRPSRPSASRRELRYEHSRRRRPQAELEPRGARAARRAGATAVLGLQHAGERGERGVSSHHYRQRPFPKVNAAMALENVAELSRVLGQRERLGLVFARHAYGMRAWVDLFSARVPAVADPEAKALLAAAGGRQRAPHDALPRAGDRPRRRPRRLRLPAPRARSSTSASTSSPGSTSSPATRSARSTTSASCWPSTAPPPTARTARAIDERHAPTCGACAPRCGPLAAAPTARAGPPRRTSSTASASWSRRRATRMPAEAALPSFADLQRELSPISPRAWRFAAAARVLARRGAAERRPADRLPPRLRLGPVHGPRLRQPALGAHGRSAARSTAACCAGARASPSATSARWPSTRCSTRCAPSAGAAARSSPTSPPGRRRTCSRALAAPARAPAPSSRDIDPAALAAARARRRARSASPTACSSCRPTPSTATALQRAAPVARRRRRARASTASTTTTRCIERHFARPRRARRPQPDRLQRADAQPRDRVHRPGLGQPAGGRCVWRLRPVEQILGCARAAGLRAGVGRRPTASASTASCGSCARTRRHDATC